MAVKLDVANSIIAAYRQGKSEADSAQENVDKKQQQATENELRQKQFEEEQKQFKERLANEKTNQAATHANEKAQLDLQHLIANAAFVKQAEDSGNAPQGFSPVSTEDYEISPGIIGQRVHAKDASGNTITYRTPETVNTQNLDLASRKQSLENEYEKDMLQYKSKLEENLNKLQGDDRFNHEKILQTQEETFKDIQGEKEFKRALALQQEKHRVDLMIAGGKAGQEIWLDDPVDPDTAKVYNVPVGTSWKEVLGNVKLDTAGKKKLEASVNFEPLVLEAKDYLSQTTDNGKRGYDRYFLGAGAGLLGDLQQKIPGLQDQYVTSIAPTLGNFFLKAKELANLGSAFTPIEKKFLADYTPGAERSLTPQAAEAMINKLIPAIRMERLNTIKTHGTKVGSKGDTTIKLSKEDTTNPNKNDLGDGFKLIDETK